MADAEDPPDPVRSLNASARRVPDFTEAIERRLSQMCLEERAIDLLVSSLERHVKLVEDLLAHREQEVNALLDYALQAVSTSLKTPPPHSGVPLEPK